ncbi:hypothetical protein G6F40_018075 [Rhizopus arrhizus]|uniref:Uncharacterized protein n=1 Tax=Rhizopus oryzae TaxID=64495 RepID=A0A9P6XLH8_RHIOR|nr:hypothetical protein G6F40_018075 [Rhizopus arrhizus]KAG1522413.1 hypothetical protein G6F51_014606 [Rhizopus arrhizus]
MPMSARRSPMRLARSARPERVLRKPSTNAVFSGSKRRPTMCTVRPAQVTEISTPVAKRMPRSLAALAASARPPTSS